MEVHPRVLYTNPLGVHHKFKFPSLKVVFDMLAMSYMSLLTVMLLQINSKINWAFIDIGLTLSCMY